MRKFNVRIEDKHFHELHHALGCPWPQDIMGETYRDHFAVSEGDDATIARMKASPHWTDGRTAFGMVYFYVTDAGRRALREHIAANVKDQPRRWVIHYKHGEFTSTAQGATPSKAKYDAYLYADCNETFREFLGNISAVRAY